MNNGSKRVIAGEGVVLVAWLIVMFVCKNGLMSPLVFVVSVLAGCLAFVASSVSLVLADGSSSRATGEVNYLPVALSSAYFAIALVANAVFCMASHAWSSTTVPIVVNVVLLALLVLLRMGLASYSRTAERNVANVAAKVAPSANLASYVGQLIASAPDGAVRAELLGLKEDMSMSSNMSQPHTQAIEQQFSAQLGSISASISAKDPQDVTLGLVREARATWRKRNAALTAVK